MKVKLAEVASHAGVGLATVDRVLNERGGVSQRTEQKVLAAAQQLGWARTVPQPYRAGLRFEVLLAHRETQVYARLNAAFERLMVAFAPRVVIQRRLVDHRRPRAFAKAMLASQCNALIIHGQLQDGIVEAIKHCTAAGMPVITLISDLPESERLAYTGIDHRRAGRAAANLLCKMADTGRFLVLNHSSAYLAHHERIKGFREGLQDYCRGTHSLQVIDHCDSEAATALGLAKVLGDSSDPLAIYNAGADNRQIERPLQRLTADGAVFVGHDFAGDAYPMLRNGVMAAAIAERIDIQVEQAVYLLLHHFGFIDYAMPAQATPFNILLRDTID